MAERMQAYFKSENDAQSALASLQRVNVSNTFVEEIPDDGNRRVLIPAVSAGTGPVNTSAGPGLYRDLWNGDDEEEHSYSHILEFEVAEEDAEEAFRLLQKEKAYIDESLSEKYKS